MDYQSYIFAIFIFIMICLLMSYYMKLKRSKKDGDNAVTDKEKKLFRLYQNIEDMLNGLEEYIEEVKADIAKEKEESAKTEEKIDAIYQKIVDASNAFEQEQAKLNESKEKETERKISREESGIPPQKMSKHGKVLYLQAKGLNEDTIAKELGISHGEVALILGIQKK